MVPGFVFLLQVYVCVLLASQKCVLCKVHASTDQVILRGAFFRLALVGAMAVALTVAGRKSV